MMNSQLKYLIFAYILMWVVIFVLPFFSFESYSIIKNTTSHLGAQNAPNGWIMNLTFICLGLGSLLSGWNYLKGYFFHRIVLSVFSLALILAAFFQHAPIEAGIPFNETEDNLHSVLASITGFAFTLFAISSAFIVRKTQDKILALSAGIIATLLSLLMFQLESLMGVWQRGIFIGSFGWMIYFFSDFGRLEPSSSEEKAKH